MQDLANFIGEVLAVQCEGKGREDLVFPGENGHHLRLASPRGQYELVRQCCEAFWDTQNQPARSPALRRQLRVSAGANVKAVQTMLGHSSATMTLNIYANLLDGVLDSVSDALDHAVSQSSVGKMWADA
ncbi:hypothetical protein NicSoilE8_16440 [Arthrobacter sp. NicSoilE8]|nr:hypothetical protein NicSoilE8_16440 [Arthrobacter sp. NicSoilE8]